MSKKGRKKKADLEINSSDDLLIDSESLKEILDQRFSKFAQEIKEFMLEQINTMKEDLKLLKNEFASLQESQQFLSNGFDSIKAQCDDLNQKLIDLASVNEMLQDNVRALQEQYVDLDNGQEDIRKYLRRDSLEIQGIPQSKTENTDQIIKEIGKLVNVSIDDCDISVSHRIPTKNKHIPQPIIVRFSRRSVKERLIGNRNLLKNKRTTHLGFSEDNKIFINDSLTPRTRDLFHAVRSYQKSFSLKSCWTRNGKVYLQESEYSSKVAFDNLESFQSYRDNCDY